MQLVAGPELDAKVAEACGWRSALVEVRGTTICVLQDFSAPPEFLACFAPRQDLNAAFAAAEKVGLFDDGALLEKRGDGLWQASKYRWSGSLTNPDPIVDEIARGATPALAICAAILALRPAQSS